MRTDHAQGLISSQQRDLSIQLFRQPLIIRIDKRHERTGGLPDCAIPCSRRSSLSLGYRNAPMRILFKDLHGVVGAPIVDGVYPEILMGLRQHAIESTVHIILNVVAGDDDIYFALGW